MKSLVLLSNLNLLNLGPKEGKEHVIKDLLFVRQVKDAHLTNEQLALNIDTLYVYIESLKLAPFHELSPS